MYPISRPTPHAPIPPYLGNEFFRRISDTSKQQIADATAHLLPTSQQIRELKSRDYSLPVFQESDWLYRAIKAYGNGQLEEPILAHLVLYDTCKRWSTFQCFTSSTSPSWKQLLQNDGFIHFEEDPKWMHEAIKEVDNSNLPHADRQVFLYFPDHNAHPHEQELLTRFRSSPRDFMPIVCRSGVAIIPPRLLYALLKARFKENAVIPCPVLGYAPKEKLSDPSKRVMSIQHGELARIETPIHGYDHSPNSALFWLHDMYHLIIESANPYRQIFVDIFRYLQSVGKKDAKLKNSGCLQCYKMHALDRDFSGLVADWVTGKPHPFSVLLELFLNSYIEELEDEGAPLSSAEEENMNRLQKLIREYVEDNHFLQLLQITS